MKIRRLAWPLAAVAAAIGAAALAVGCGGDSDDAAGDTASDRRMEAALDWAKCMRENGANVPDPRIGANGLIQIGPRPGEDAPSEATMRRAAKECDDILRRGGPGRPPSAEERERMEQAALEHARCMRKHGVDVPDPRFDGEGGGVAIEIDPERMSSPAWRAAEKACGSLLGRAPAPSE